MWNVESEYVRDAMGCCDHLLGLNLAGLLFQQQCHLRCV